MSHLIIFPHLTVHPITINTHTSITYTSNHLPQSSYLLPHQTPPHKRPPSSLQLPSHISLSHAQDATHSVAVSDVGEDGSTVFPCTYLFKCLPCRKQILDGMLGANLICFQTPATVVRAFSLL
ncbi:hypothetical protein EDB19DRAFT_1331174 [Suillus lakei]|nr:hypothetical protein EDB19DRAFT_1331174 [Suillus lakei]